VSLANEPVRHSVRPSLLLDFANTEALDPRITFARASTARYYNGVTTAKAEENLLVRSQEFETTWSASRVTVSANTGDTTAPDGTNTAEKVTNNNINDTHLLFQPLTLNGQAYTFSVFAKKGTANFVVLRGSDGTAARNVWFNLDTGAVATTQTNITASIVNVGDGWYRCIGTWSASASSSQNYVVGISEADNTFIYAGTDKDIFLWGAQLEQRSAVTAYTPTTTQPITNYVPVLLSAANNVARFDHNPVTGESLGLLIEEQRTNLFLRSEEFDDAYWTKTASTITANTVVAPDGTLSADKLVNDPAASGYFGRISTIPLGVPVTVSVFAKQGEDKGAEIRFLTSTGSVAASFNLETGQVNSFSAASDASASGANITPVGNGWYRISVTGQLNSGASSQIRVFARNADGTTAAGNGFNGAYFWGTQVEQGAFPTSYIPTVASQVTRSADAASMTGANFSSWYNAAEGTLYAEAMLSYTPAASTFPMLACADDGTINNRIALLTNSSRDIRAQVAIGGVFTTISTATSYSVGTPFKAAAAFATNNHAVSLNSGTVATNTSVRMPPPASTFRIGEQATTGANANGHIRKIAYYPKRLANAELQGLTTV
jgi:hypothetical protein